MKKQSNSSTANVPAQQHSPGGLLIETLDVSRMDGVPDVSPMIEDFAPPQYYKCQKTGIVTRPATLDEKARLMTAAKLQGMEVCCDLQKGPAWVADLNGEIISCLRARLVFEVQPFPVTGWPLKAEMNERSEQLLLEACHQWMRSFRNGLGVEESFQVATTPDRQNLLKRLGWKALDVAQSTFFGKNFGDKHNGK